MRSSTESSCPPCRFPFGFLLFSTLLFLLASCRDGDIPITIHTGEWSPYTSQEPNGISLGTGGAYGQAADVVSAVLREMRYEPVYRFEDWALIEDGLREGRIEAAFPFIQTRRRLGHGLKFSDPLLESRGVLYFNRENLKGKPTDKSSISGMKFGFVKGFEYDEVKHGEAGGNGGGGLSDWTFPSAEAPNVMNFNSEIESFAALVKGEVDLVPASDLVGNQILDAHFTRSEQGRVGILSEFSESRSLRLVVPGSSPGGARFLREFNRALSRVREKGIDRILLAPYDSPSRTGTTVLLCSIEGHPVILATRGPGEHEQNPAIWKAQVPHGTRAEVLDWGRPFEGDSFDVRSVGREKTRVRILEGPLKNEVLWVPCQFVAFRD